MQQLKNCALYNNTHTHVGRTMYQLCFKTNNSIVGHLGPKLCIITCIQITKKNGIVLSIIMQKVSIEIRIQMLGKNKENI